VVKEREEQRFLIWAAGWMVIKNMGEKPVVFFFIFYAELPYGQLIGYAAKRLASKMLTAKLPRTFL